ncbi:hypothetical protein ACHAWU_005405 [Discostella pseudostelligera]|uniref:SWIM-type domain-containing protein n=1 Tax=Discostella pseudostelligera TaxID=259834 RepID=A0ABD3MR03_9STRA
MILSANNVVVVGAVQHQNNIQNRGHDQECWQLTSSTGVGSGGGSDDNRDGDNGVNDGVNDGYITSTALSDALTALDHGISANDTGRQGHVTSLTRCSCQYPKCWGLPCRHIFRVMMELGADCWTTCNDDDAILDSTFSN